MKVIFHSIKKAKFLCSSTAEQIGLNILNGMMWGGQKWNQGKLGIQYGAGIKYASVVSVYANILSLISEIKKQYQCVTKHNFGESFEEKLTCILDIKAK